MDTWSEIADHYHQFVDSPADKLRTELLYPILWETMSPLQGKRVLDIGCGNGFFAYHLAQKGAEVDAFDNQAMVGIAQQYFAHSGIKYIVHDGNMALPYADGKYDCIVANLVLMDMKNIETILAETRRLIKPTGQILFSVLHPCFTPPVGKFRRGIKGRIKQAWSYFHLNNYFQVPSPTLKQSFGPLIPATNYYHRTLSTYLHHFHQAGLVMTDMFEPYPADQFIKKYPQFFHAQKISIFSIFVLQKNKIPC